MHIIIENDWGLVYNAHVIEEVAFLYGEKGSLILAVPGKIPKGALHVKIAQNYLEIAVGKDVFVAAKEVPTAVINDLEKLEEIALLEVLDPDNLPGQVAAWAKVTAT